MFNCVFVFLDPLGIQVNRAWTCINCNQNNTDQLYSVEKINSAISSRKFNINVFECFRCHKICQYSMSLIVTIKNPFYSKELKGRILWDAYFQEIPDDDFKDRYSPKWKLSSIDSRKPTFYARSKMSFKDAVECVFNKDNFDRPAWNKRYLLAFQQWIIEFPSLDHHSVLMNVALEMGIEQIRYHSGPEAFFPQEKCYILVGNNSESQTSPRNEAMIKLGICGNMFYDYDEFTLEENIDLVRGINFIGMGKWNDVLKNSALMFSTFRTSLCLMRQFSNLEKQLRVIRFGGKLYKVIPGYEIQCIEPIENSAQSDSETSVSRRMLTNMGNSNRKNKRQETTEGNIIDREEKKSLFNMESNSSRFQAENSQTTPLTDFSECHLGDDKFEGYGNVVVPCGDMSQLHSKDTPIREEPCDDLLDDLTTKHSVNSLIKLHSATSNEILDVLNEYMNTSDSAILIQKLSRIPTQYEDNFRFSEFYNLIPRRWRRAGHWRSCFNR